MRSTSLLALLVGGTLLSLAPWTVALAPAPTEPVGGPFDRELLRIAAEYKTWGRVDDEMRWSPELCRIPNPGLARFSASRDADTHGRKLYSLLTRQRGEYLKIGKEKSVKVGFAIVKQSWLPEEVADPKEIPARGIDRRKVVSTPGPRMPPKDDVYATFGDHFYPYAFKDDKCYKAAKQADLFIMFKLDSKTPGTDDGWVYGTVTPDGKKVTAAGRVASCMKCHQDAPHDRLFGLPR